MRKAYYCRVGEYRFMFWWKMPSFKNLRFWALLILLFSSLEQVFPVYSVTEDMRVEIFDEYTFFCSRDSGTFYTEKVQHKLIVNAFEASGGSHNITLTLETDEELIYTRPRWPQVKNRTANGEITIETPLSTSYLYLEIGLNCSQIAISNPFDFEILPNDLSILPVDADGHLEFALALNSSDFIENADLTIASPQNRKNRIRSFSVDTLLNITEELDYQGDLNVDIFDIPKGNYSMRFRIRFAEIEGQVEARLCLRRGGKTYHPVRCLIDGEEIDCHKQINMYYETPEKEFIRAGENWIYGYDDYSYYIINFTTTDDSLPLRIDRLSREMIDFIHIESDITEISVKETTICDNPCYLLRFALKHKANVSMGLMIYEKVWFISSKTMSFDKVPRQIVDKYTDPKMMGYGCPSCIDKNSSFVQKWYQEVSKDESNPCDVALSIFENLSSTLKYNENLTGHHLPASEILQNRTGVCEHFSVAYAALCAAAGIPVRYVVGSVFRLEELWKKDHAWNEIFLPGYGWIPVDVTWKFFGKLPASHFLSTSWTYENNTLSVTEVSPPQVRWGDSTTLYEGLNCCRTKLEEAIALRRYALWVPHSLDLLIDSNYNKISKMETSAEHTYTHDALISIADILLSTNGIIPAVILFAVVPPILILSVCLAVIFVKRKRILSLFK